LNGMQIEFSRPRFGAVAASIVVVSLVALAAVSGSVGLSAGAADRGASPPAEASSAFYSPPLQTEPIDETPPIVEPELTPEPAHLPVAYRAHDKAVPPPLLAEASGNLERLSTANRTACAPATHQIRAADEAADVLAVLYAARSDDPLLELDLYLGELVRVRGTEGLTPTGCEEHWRIIGVEDVTVIEPPPGLTN
jgi:hypothetical protein